MCERMDVPDLPFLFRIPGDEIFVIFLVINAGCSRSRTTSLSNEGLAIRCGLNFRDSVIINPTISRRERVEGKEKRIAVDGGQTRSASLPENRSASSLKKKKKKTKTAN